MSIWSFDTGEQSGQFQPISRKLRIHQRQSGDHLVSTFSQSPDQNTFLYYMKEVKRFCLQLSVTRDEVKLFSSGFFKLDLIKLMPISMSLFFEHLKGYIRWKKILTCHVDIPVQVNWQYQFLSLACTVSQELNKCDDQWLTSVTLRTKITRLSNFFLFEKKNS